MDHVSDERWQQAARYLAEEATADERVAFERWLDESPAHRHWFGSLQTIWERKGDGGEPFDVDAAWVNIRQRMQALPQRRARSDRRPSRRTRDVPSRVAAIVAVLLVVVGLAWWLSDSPSGEPEIDSETQLIATDTGERLSVSLSDGTQVTLAPETSMEIPPTFGSDGREIVLRGEAMFDVAPDAERPFVVTTNRGSIRVLGTRFVVRDYESEEPFKVAVEEGTVETGVAGESARVEAGQVATRGERGLEVQPILDPAVHFGWVEGRLAFRDARMQHVAASLERWYDLDIVFEDSAIASRRVTANFDGTSPRDVMNVIALTIDARLERQGSTYRLRRAHAE